MFGLFKKKSEIEKLEDKHRKLMSKAYEVSHSNRKKGDELLAEADKLERKIEDLKKEQDTKD